MERQQLIRLFEQGYDPEAWRGLLRQLFPSIGFASVVQERRQEIGAHADVKSIRLFADHRLQDKSRVAFYEVELVEGKQVTGRVSLRNIIAREVIPDNLDAIVATYYAPDSNEWRVSLISKSMYWDDEQKLVQWETHPKRYTYVLGEGQRIATATEQFLKLFEHLRGEADLQGLVEAFSVERISNEFFKKYFHHFKNFEEYLTNNTAYFKHFQKHVDRSIAAAEQQKEAERLVRNFVKKLLGRIVFLYFLQKKGWLGVAKDKDWGEGDADFISNLFNNCTDASQFYEQVLVPLFFDTLNRQRADDLFAVNGTKVPFLNGGLFDNDGIEPTKVRFEPKLWVDLFEFFGSYNFTIDENIPDDQDIGIDPEMLGHIFENLLEDNKDKGTFYTPKEVVHYMCKESLRLYVRERLTGKTTEEQQLEIDRLVLFNHADITQTVRNFATDIIAALDEVRICDPAIGSGAFPMGMVYEILRLKKELSPFTHKYSVNFDYRDEKLRIMRTNIYGVDIDGGAVDIARLRFWLSLIVDEQEPSPLPNLDYRIMQGNSLLERFEDISLDKLVQSRSVTVFKPTQLTLGEAFDAPQKEIEFSEDEMEALATNRDKYFDVVDQVEKGRLHEGIDTVVRHHIDRNIELKKNQLGRQIGEIEDRYKNAGNPIEKQSRGRDYNAWKKLNTQLDVLKKHEKKLRELQDSTERPYFLWHLFFEDVLEKRGGFDIVIGNPPYGVKVDDTTRQEYGLQNKDSYGMFTALALQKLLRPKGMLCYIVSDTWLTIGSHLPLRKMVLDGHRMHKVIRLHADCFDAVVNSCIFTVEKDAVIEAPVIASEAKQSPDPSLRGTKQSGSNPEIASGKDPRNDERIIAADLTNVSTRKNVPVFRELLFNLEQHVNESTINYAVYAYPQQLLETNHNRPIIVGSPKLFQLMNTELVEISSKKFDGDDGSSELDCRNVVLNDLTISLVRFGDNYIRRNNQKEWMNEGLFRIVSGIKTGSNADYLRVFGSSNKSFDEIDERLVLDWQAIDISEEERASGLQNNRRKYYVPFEMGLPSSADDGFLPSYYQAPSKIAINWSTSAVSDMKDEGHSDLANAEFRFRPLSAQISFSTTGIYAPTFRISVAPIFVNKSSRIDLRNIVSRPYALAVVNSRLTRFILKNYVNHSVDVEVEDLKELPFPTIEVEELGLLVETIMSNQMQNPRYDYASNEQKEIDRLVYELYGLNEEDINEVETWFARRYSKLAAYADIKEPQQLALEAAERKSEVELLHIIQKGENKQMEMKATLRWCIKTASVQGYIEHAVMKNIAAFLNSEGGTLFIGVNDAREVVGLESTDFPLYSRDDKEDAMQLHFDNLIDNYLGKQYHAHIKLFIQKVQGLTIGMVEVKQRAAKPVKLINMSKPDKPEEFYIRRSASALKLNTEFEIDAYVKERWGVEQSS